MRPDLFAAVNAQVPFVDVVSTMSDPSLPLTITEWEEWGDPRAEPYASYIASYSPYDKDKAAGKPLLFTAVDEQQPEPHSLDARFCAPTSMRDVEASVHLWIERRALGGKR